MYKHISPTSHLMHLHTKLLLDKLINYPKELGGFDTLYP